MMAQTEQFQSTEMPRWTGSERFDPQQGIFCMARKQSQQCCKNNFKQSPEWHFPMPNRGSNCSADNWGCCERKQMARRTQVPNADS